MAVDGSLYDEYAGTYESEDYTIDFVRADEKLVGRIRGREMQFVPGLPFQNEREPATYSPLLHTMIPRIIVLSRNPTHESPSTKKRRITEQESPEIA